MKIWNNIKIENGKVSARDLHERLEIKTRFDKWIQRMLNYGFVENVDFILVGQKRPTNNPKNPITEYTDYLLTLDTAKEISMITGTHKGKEARQYFIQCEKLLEEMRLTQVLHFMETKEVGVTVTSREIAEHFEKKHYHVLRDIEKIIDELNSKLRAVTGNELNPKLDAHLFIEGSYITKDNRIQKQYLITRAGFDLLAMGFTGKKALQWKLAYIEKFDRMEKELEKTRLNNIKQVTMIFTHKDKLKLTKNVLYPILDGLGILKNKRIKVHNLIKSQLIGKYENVTMIDDFDVDNFVKEYTELANFYKQEYYGWFKDDNQISFFEVI